MEKTQIINLKLSNYLIYFALFLFSFLMSLFMLSITSSIAFARDGDGACNDAPAKSDEQPGDNVTLTAPSGENITKICIKEGFNHTIFTNDGSSGCYSASGLGTGIVTVQRNGEGSDCQEISHIDYYYGHETSPTPTPTSTLTPTPEASPSASPTPTPTDTPIVISETTPTPTFTPTPTLTVSPTDSPTPTLTSTPTPTATPTPTSTSSNSSSSDSSSSDSSSNSSSNSSNNSSNNNNVGGTSQNLNSNPFNSTLDLSGLIQLNDGEVLGVSTSDLPKTGPESFWLFLASFLSTSGGGLIITSKIIKK